MIVNLMGHGLGKLFAVSVIAAMCGCSRGGSTHTGTTGGSNPAPTEALVWSDEFRAAAGAPAQSQPNPANWTYDLGGGGWGNGELQTYCGWASSAGPCNSANPNAYVGADGYLHIVARRDAKGNYTSARMKTQGLQSFQYGRIEARIKIPKGQGFWPAFWMLGNNIDSINWPACGEMDIMESLGSQPSINNGSIHGAGFTGSILGLTYTLPNGQKLGDTFHNYGMIWSPKKIQYYVDDPSNIYATFTPASLPGGAVWPFDQGKFFFLLNLAVGGTWGGSPDQTTVFPQEMQVDYVRIYSEPAP